MRLLLVGSFVTALAISGCSSSEQPTEPEPVATQAAEVRSTVAQPSTLNPKPTVAPAADPVMRDFWLRVDREGYLTVNVNGTYTDEELQSVFLEVRRMYTNTTNTKKGGWHVQVNCGDSMKSTGGARQANGKFALDSLGAAQTGLAAGGYEFEPLPNRAPCPDPQA